MTTAIAEIMGILFGNRVTNREFSGPLSITPVGTRIFLVAFSFSSFINKLPGSLFDK